MKKAPFKIEVKLKGIFEAAETAEVALAPKAWAELVVLRAVEQGTRVKKGDQVLWLDLEKIDEAIRKAEADEALAELSLKQAEEGLRALEKTTPLDLAAAERANKRFAEDQKHFFDVDLPHSKKSWAFSLKQAEFSLMYATEELRQLEKMYKADDLTEETEEIILKRARHNVERAKLAFESSKSKVDKAFKHDIPRSEENARVNAERQAVSYAKSKITLPVQLRQKQLELEKHKRGRKEAGEKLAEMKRDRDKMTVRAPIDGVVYYGQCVSGHWTTAAALAASLRKGGALKPHQVFMTIVRPRPMLARTGVPEEELHRLGTGLAAEVVPTGYPDLKLAAKLESVAPVPVKEGSFDAKLSLVVGKDAKALVPGMTCSITIVAYRKKDAIAVPVGLVLSDQADPSKRYVWVLGKDGKGVRRDVTVGKKGASQIEILAGLKPGETIVPKQAAEKK